MSATAVHPLEVDVLAVDRGPGLPAPPLPDTAQLLAAYGLKGRVSRLSLVPGGRSPDRLWCLQTSLGTYAVKQFAPGHPARQPDTLNRNIRFQRAAWEAGVPMPEPILAATGEGAAIIAVGGDGEARAVTLHRWTSGCTVSYDENIGQRRDAALQMAAGMAKLHRLDWKISGASLPWFRVSMANNRWLEYAERAEQLRFPWAGRLKAALPGLEFADSLIAEDCRSLDDAMGHGDANPHNVIRMQRGIAIVDWDGANPVSAEEEFAAVLSGWARGAEGPDDQLAAEMVRTYRAHGGKFEPHGLHVFAMKMASAVNWLNLCAEVALGLADHPRMTREDASEQVVGMLNWVDSVHEVEHLLDVVSSLS